MYSASSSRHCCRLRHPHQRMSGQMQRELEIAERECTWGISYSGGEDSWQQDRPGEDGIGTRLATVDAREGT